MVFSHWSGKGNLQTRFCRQSDQLIITVALFHVIHYNRPNLKVVEAWEKNELLTVSSFCRSYRNTVTDIAQSKKCMKMSVCTLVRADKGRVAWL